jgi:hypothetical protein
MSLMIMEDVLANPDAYVDDIYRLGFGEFEDGENVFKGVQQRPNTDEFAYVVSELFPSYDIALNFVRRSPYMQEEPNFIHTDEMMGDVTCILYLNKYHPDEDGTTLYDDEGKPSMIIKAKYNKMFCFDSSMVHSRNMYNNFGEDRDARLIQVIFLIRRDE